MENYNVELTRAAEKQLRVIPKMDLQRIVDALAMLAITPRPQGCRKLSGQIDLYRVRVGTYRIVYEIFDARLVVRILKIGHRKNVYR